MNAKTDSRISKKRLIRRIGSGNQITLPQPFIKTYNLQYGDFVEVINEGSHVIVRPAPQFQSSHRQDLIDNIKTLLESTSSDETDEEALLETLDQEKAKINP